MPSDLVGLVLAEGRVPRIVRSVIERAAVDQRLATLQADPSPQAGPANKVSGVVGIFAMGLIPCQKLPASEIAAEQDPLAFLLREALTHRAAPALTAIHSLPVTWELTPPTLQGGGAHTPRRPAPYETLSQWPGSAVEADVEGFMVPAWPPRQVSP